MRHRDRIPELIARRHPVIGGPARRPVAILVLVVATLIVGGIALSRIQLAAFPPGFESRSLSIEVNLRATGARLSPEEVEKKITLPIEGELATIPGIQTLKSSSSRTGAEFDLAFSPDTDLKLAYSQVRDRMERAKGVVGDLIDTPSIRRDQGMGGGQSIAAISITWDSSVVNPWDKFNNRVRPSIEASPGVAGMRIWGEETMYYRVALNGKLLAAHPEISVQTLRSGLSGDNFSASAGKLADGEHETFVVVNSRFESLTDLKKFPVTATLKLEDIADVRETRSTGSYNFSYAWDDDKGYVGGRGVYCPVNKTSDANIVTTGLELETTVERLREDPQLKGFQFLVSQNQAVDIIAQLKNLQETLLLGGLLAVAVLLLFLKRVRLALIIALAMPLSMTMALVVMYFCGEYLSLLALMGFTVASGMLVDNAIVVSENIYRRMAIDRHPFQAAVLGASEVGLAITMATSTTVVVFLAFAFFSSNDFTSFLMARLGFPICLSLAFSILVALAIIPWTMSSVYGSGKEPRVRRLYYRVTDAAARLPGPAKLAGVPLTLLFGRRPGTPCSTGLGDRLDASRYRALWYLLALAVGAAAGTVAAYFAFKGLGGEQFVEPLWAKTVKLFESAFGTAPPAPQGGMRGSSMGGMGGFGAKEAPIQPTLVAMTVFVSTTITPLLVLHLAPRKQQEMEQAPVAARLAQVYGCFVAWLLRRKLSMLVYASLAIGIAAWAGFAWVGKTEQNQGSKAWLFMNVRLPDNLRATATEPEVTGETVSSSTGTIPPEWAYFFTVRERLFGIAYGKPIDNEKVQAAHDKFGLARGSMILRPGGIMMFLQLDSSKAGESKAAEERIKAAFPDAAGFRASGGFDMSELNKLRVVVRGPEYSVVEEYTQKIALALADVPGLSSVSDGKDQVAKTGEALLSIDRQRAMSQGVSAETMAMVIAFQVNGSRLNDYTQGEVVRQVRVVYDYPETRAGEQRNATLDDVLQMRIPGADGNTRVEAVVAPGVVAYGGPDSISREDRMSAAAVTATPEGSTDAIIPRIQQVLDQVELPAGYEAEIMSGTQSGGRGGGRGGGRRGGGGGLGGASNPLGDWGVMLAAVALIWIVMATLFESVTRPMIVLLACIPGAAAGAVWTLLIAGTLLDIICSLGLILLLGVAVNNGIVYVDLINRLRDQGVPLDQAIRQTGEQRLRPMLMTSLTTALGLVPMALGTTEFIDIPYSPLAQVLLGGMLVSTVVTLTTVPLFYGVVEGARDYFATLWGLTMRGGAAKPQSGQ